MPHAAKVFLVQSLHISEHELNLFSNFTTFFLLSFILTKREFLIFFSNFFSQFTFKYSINNVQKVFYTCDPPLFQYHKYWMSVRKDSEWMITEIVCAKTQRPCAVQHLFFQLEFEIRKTNLILLMSDWVHKTCRERLRREGVRATKSVCV